MTFIGIGSRADIPELEEFVARHELAHFVQIHDEDQALWNRFGASGRSTFLFLNDDGTFSRTGYGEVNHTTLVERIEALISS